MAASVPHLCVFCESDAPRLHVADTGRFVSDCGCCGYYPISSELGPRSCTVRNHRFLIPLRRRIKPANRRGVRLDVETLLEVPLGGASYDG